MDIKYIGYKPQTTEAAQVLIKKLGVAAAPKVQAFHATIPGYRVTPMISLACLARVLGLKAIYVKDESTRFGLNAFKGLGASYAMGKLLGNRLELENLDFSKLVTPEAKTRLGEQNFIAVTDGNHGRGVAWFANLLGYKAKIYMPRGTVQARIDNIAREGAEVTVHTGNYDDAIRFVTKKAEDDGWLMIQDTAWKGYESIPLDIMRGYNTMAKEMVEQLREVDAWPTHVFLQAGVGSMAAAVVAFLVDYCREVKLPIPFITIVEPTVANCLYESGRAQERQCVDGDMASMMAGLCCGEPCTLAWEILKGYAQCFICFEDSVDAEGMCCLAKPVGTDMAITSGESGAAGFSAMLAAMTKPELADLKELLRLDSHSVVLCISTEGATDKVNYKKIVG